jgi:hypothetical protein
VFEPSVDGAARGRKRGAMDRRHALIRAKQDGKFRLRHGLMDTAIFCHFWLFSDINIILVRLARFRVILDAFVFKT